MRIPLSEPLVNLTQNGVGKWDILSVFWPKEDEKKDILVVNIFNLIFVFNISVFSRHNSTLRAMSLLV